MLRNIWPRPQYLLVYILEYLCRYLHTICHPFLSNLFAGEMFSTCARSLAAMSRDLAHVLNISPVNRLYIESIVCLQNGNWIYCKYMYGIHYRCNSILTKEKTSKLSLLPEVLCIHVKRPPTHKWCIPKVFVLCRIFSYDTSYKVRGSTKVTEDPHQHCPVVGLHLHSFVAGILKNWDPCKTRTCLPA